MLTVDKKQTSLLKPDLTGSYQSIVSGEGVYLFDEHGNRYIDGCSGAINNNIGHGIPEIAEEAFDQIKRVSFVYRSQFTNPWTEALANRVTEKSNSLDWAFFVNSGSEAIEAAIRLSIQYWVDRGMPQKQKILSRKVSYHGSTFGALSVSGHYGRRRPFLNKLSDEPVVEPPYCYRCPFNQEPSSCNLECANSLESTIKQMGEENIAAFVIEPIIGASGGAIVPEDGYLQRVKSICEKYNVLLILDEVMTGFGRTGRWFAHEHWDTEPDIAVIGKGISAGYTSIAAVLCTSKITGTIKERSGKLNIFGHTYSGNPLSCATSLAVINYLEKYLLVNRVRDYEPLLQEHMNELYERFTFIGDIRGKGFVWGIEFVKDRTVGKDPFPDDVANKIVEIAHSKGLMVYPTKSMINSEVGDGLIVSPPFVISKEEIEELFFLLNETLQDFERYHLGG